MSSTQTAEARDLIDLVADAMDSEKEPEIGWKIGRELIVAYFTMHPQSAFAVAQASKYLLMRTEETV